MNKKKLKILLNLLGIILLIITVVVVLKEGLREVGTINYNLEFEPQGYEFYTENLEFEYIVPLLIGSVICFIIAACLKTNGLINTKTTETNFQVQNNKSQTTSEKLEKLQELLDKHLITGEEFSSKRSEILSKEF